MAGFGTTMPDTPVSFLGSWGASPWEVASAYTIFPNDGIRYRPYLISEIKDRDGNILYPGKDEQGHAISPQLSYPAAKAGSESRVNS